MSRVAVGESSSADLPFGRGQHQKQVMAKRKTPSELRGEQLKRNNFQMAAASQLPSFLSTDCDEVTAVPEVKKTEPFKVPKYIDTRVSKVFPVKKSSNGALNQENPKHDLQTVNKTTRLDMFSKMIKTSAVCTTDEISNSNTAVSEDDEMNNLESSIPVTKENTQQISERFGKGTQNTFRSVAELSRGNEKSCGLASIDMDKALKGFVSRDLPSRVKADPPGDFHAHSSILSQNFCSELRIRGNKIPLDLTLKTSLRVVSSSPVKWCHRIFASAHCPGSFSSCCDCTIRNTNSKLNPSSTTNALFHKALCSWAYPQSSLPSSVISAILMSSSTADFLKKRQQDWEDSFCNLYCMLRMSECNIFYVSTSHFTVLFIGGNFSLKGTRSCNAFLSQSTHGLRSLLAEHDIPFSMPLCRSQVEQATADDLVEFLEIEKHNIGQALHMDSSLDVDNSPQSLLAFLGNDRVHAFYDFLLNYRFRLRALTSLDVPLLLAPVPFRNAAVSIPKVQSKEIKRVNACSEADGLKATSNTSPDSVCYSIEIKDQIIPPWILSRTCVAMGSQASSFESSFTTEPKSIGLNAALDVISAKTDAPAVGDDDEGSSGTLCVPHTTVLQDLKSSYLNGLKCVDGSYVASVTPL